MGDPITITIAGVPAGLYLWKSYHHDPHDQTGLINIRITDMHSARRSRAVARPRQVAMYLAKQLTARSLPEIGRKFGGRDHTTVMHAVKKVDELRQADSAFAEDVELLRRMLEG